MGEPMPLNENNIRSQRMMTSSLNATKNTLTNANFVPEDVSNLPPAMEEETMEEEEEPQIGGAIRGGSLMESLLKVSADTAHAIVLAGSAMEISRRMKKRKSTRRHRSGKKKQTRRK